MTEATKILVRAFVGSRADYCNSWNQWSAASQTQTKQNAAARLITSTKKRMMLVLLDWLPVRQRREFKTALFVYKFVHGLAPPYLAEFCQASSDQPDPSPLRSADLYQLHVPRTKKNLGNQSFSVNGAVVWHSLPVDLRTPVMSLDTFKLQLKTLLTLKTLKTIRSPIY